MMILDNCLLFWATRYRKERGEAERAERIRAETGVSSSRLGTHLFCWFG